MIDELADCLVVNGALWVLTGVPLAVPLWRGLRGRWRWSAIVLVTVAGGACLQAVCGLLWDHWVGASARAEIGLFYGVCGVATAVALLWPCRGSRSVARPVARSRGDGAARWDPLALIGILLLACIVRELHPLRTAYLGQSDAYTHATFIKDVVQHGQIRHPAYPPGYHWVMGLPAVVLDIDPYIVARYGGAFFGVLLTLAVFVLVRERGGAAARPAAFYAALLVASCPALTLLLKTGVGAFANQMGLALLPVLLYTYVGLLRSFDGGAYRCGWAALLGLTAAGLAASVPLMFVHALLFVGIERLAALFRPAMRTTALRSLPSLAAALAPALLLVAFHATHAGAKQRACAAAAMTGIKAPSESAPSSASGAAPGASARARPRAPMPTFLTSAWAMLRDFLSIKRAGLNGTAYTLAAATVLAFFLGLALGGGGARGEPWAHALGWFGVLAGVQTLTGLFEFSMYQRAGWYLLEGLAVAGGMVAAVVGARLPPRVARVVVAGGCMVCVAWGLCVPPVHAASLSSAESALVRTVRSLGAIEARRGGIAPPRAFERPAVPDWAAALRPELPVTLVVRTASGLRGTYWEVASAVLPPGAPLNIVYADARRGLALTPRRDRQYAVFLDRSDALDARDLGSFARVDPEQAKVYAAWQHALYRANGALTAWLDALPRAAWKCPMFELGEGARLVLAIPGKGDTASSEAGAP